MRRDNEAILKERHVIPKIDEIIADLHGAKLFSKIDLREGYHQIQLDKYSRDITTFEWHKSLFRYKRLVYGGCKTAFEMFQKIVEVTITGCIGARNVNDDILMWGSNMEELVARAENVFQKLNRSGLIKLIFAETESRQIYFRWMGPKNAV